MNNNDPHYEDQSATGRWTATTKTGSAATTDSKPAGTPAPIPKAAIVAWAAGPGATPSGRKGKKTRRRTRRIVAALAVIFVMSTVGTTGAFAQSSFYKASPYVDNEELVDAGAKSFDERLAIGEPESTPNAPAVATNLEEAILTGGLSPGKMHMPDMMLAGISGDEMALAAAADDNSPMADGGADGGAKPDEQAARPTDDAPPDAGGDSTVGDLAKSASDENPDGYASPALGGDPEPIVDEYAQTDGGPGGEPAPAQDQASQPPVNTELAGADPAEPEPSGTDRQTQAQVDPGTDPGARTDAPTEPTAPDDGAQSQVNEEPAEAAPLSDELAVVQPPEPNDGGSEGETVLVPADRTIPTETTSLEPTTEEPTTEEPSEGEGSGPADSLPDAEPDDDAEQAFADPSVTDEDYEDPPADEQPASHPSTADPSADGGSEGDDGSSELAATPLPAPSEGEPMPEDTGPDKPTGEDDSLTDQASIPPDEDLSDQTLSEVGSDNGYTEEETVPEEPDQEQEQEEDPGEEQDASTASINQSSSMQVFADEGSSAEAHSIQVAAINGEGETDQNSLSYPPDQGGDNGRVPEMQGDPTADEGAEEEEYAAAEPDDNNETTTAEDPSVSEEGLAQPPGENQGDPASESGQNSETPPPTGTEPGGTEPGAADTTADEAGQGPQEIDNQNQRSGTPQNTTPQSGDPQDELPNGETTGSEDSSPQEAPARVTPAEPPAQPSERQPEKNQSEPARQLGGSGEPEPDDPNSQPDIRQDPSGRTHLAPGTKPAPAQQASGGTETPNASEPAIPPVGGRERPNKVTRPSSSTEAPAGPGKQSIQPQAGGDHTQAAGRPSSKPINPPVPQQRVQQQLQQQQQGLRRDMQEGVQQVEEQAGNAVEEQSFTPDPAAEETAELEPTAPADSLSDGSAAGIESGPSPGAVDETNWANQPAVSANQQADVAEQAYVEPAVEPAPAQPWEQPVQQTGVGASTGLSAEQAATTDQNTVSQNTPESTEGVAQKAADPYAGEGSVGTQAAPDSGTYNTNSYGTDEASGADVDPGAAPVDGTPGGATATPAVEESYPVQDTATPNYDPGYETQDSGTYGEAQEAVPVQSAPTYEETYPEESAQVPAQELEPAPQVASQKLEPAPQVTNTLAGESSVAPSVAPSSGTSGAASPATGVGESQPSVDDVVQNTTSNITRSVSGGQK